MAVVHRPKPTSVSQPRHTPVAQASIELYWLPLGAGGWFVRLNGRIYEAIHARLEWRQPLDLYHTALVVHLPEGRFVIEDSWPIPDADGRSRGVVVQGPVASRRLARFRVFRYEVRRWLDGVIADAICPPAGGRAPGWRAGVVNASTVDPRSRRQPTGRGPPHTGLPNIEVRLTRWLCCGPMVGFGAVLA